MKQFYIKCVIFLALLFATDFLVGIAGKLIMLKLNEGNYSGKVAMMSYNINYAAPEIAIIGSSPALSAYIPSVLKDSIASISNRNMDIRNASCYVQGLPYFLAELKTLISRKKTELVILDMNPRYLSDFKDITSVLMPYSISNKEIKQIVQNDVDKTTRFLQHCNAYCLNTEIFSLFFGFTTPKGADGYCPNYGSLKVIPRDTVYNQPLDASNVRLFEEFISLTKENGIHLMVVTSPTCHYFDKDCEANKKLIELCAQNDISYYDFMNDEISGRDDIYADETHLNDEGAHIFSSYFFSKIRGELIHAIE